jgi:hypothetical protein
LVVYFGVPLHEARKRNIFASDIQIYPTSQSFEKTSKKKHDVTTSLNWTRALKHGVPQSVDPWQGFESVERCVVLGSPHEAAPPAVVGGEMQRLLLSSPNSQQPLVAG